jgi:PiT family inorganic phosphate transporter
LSQKTAIAHYSYSSAGSDSPNLTDKDKSECYILDLEREAYRFLLIISACLVCLAHGSNDVANSIAPLLVELNISGENTEWAYWLGGVGIALGLLTLGYKVMETVGKNVIKLDFYKGYSC